MFIYLYLAMSILVNIHSKIILIKIIQITFGLFNQLYPRELNSVGKDNA